MGRKRRKNGSVGIRMRGERERTKVMMKNEIVEQYKESMRKTMKKIEGRTEN